MTATTMVGMLAIVALLTAPTAAIAGNGAAAQSTAIPLFLAVVTATLAITAWGARYSKSPSEFYAAGGVIKPWQNGVAIAGDALSAGAFLGLTALVYAGGFDGLVYAVGYTVGFPIVVFLLAERLRAMGKYTFSDVICNRVRSPGLRMFSGIASLVIVFFYLIAQMVGAGQLVRLLFGFDYAYAELLVGALMITYVLFGGMVATTWVQFSKAILLLLSGTALALMVLHHFAFSYDHLLSAAMSAKPAVNMLGPTSLSRNPISAISLGLSLMMGTAGLPHVLMRFFTVRDVRAARNSVVWAVTLISYFYALIFVLGFGAVAIVATNPDYVLSSGQLVGGANMAAVHLADALGGDLFMGIISAVAFATILAVVAGLTLAGASAVSHDLYANSIRVDQVGASREVMVSRISALVIGAVAVGLGIVFEKQNVAYMVSLAFGIAASSTFPLLVLSIFWRGFTAKGAIVGGVAGLSLSVVLTLLGPTIWVQSFGFAKPIVALEPPTIISMPVAFLLCLAVSSFEKNNVRLRGDPFKEDVFE
jgi:cation/acetate symporter